MTSIFVAKLDFGITSEQLKQAFQQYGTVLKASVATDRETGKSRGFGFVEMSDRDEALTAIKELDGSQMNGRPIAVKEAEQRTDSRPPRDSNTSGGTPFRSRDDQQRPGGFQRTETRTTDYKKPGEDAPVPFTPPLIDPLKTEQRKKEKDKKAKDWDSEGKAKKPKMNAYKKSGKNNRFFGDDDDEEWDDEPLNLFGEDDEEDYLEEDEDFDDED